MSTRKKLPIRQQIGVRLMAAAVVVAVTVGASFLAWAAHERSQAAVEEAKSFAMSVHQMTMAGLTGMMITGTVDQREVFLDQIRESDHVASVRVIRSPAVMRQFGIGFVGEMAADEMERSVLASGQPSYVVINTSAGPRLRAVLPTPASTDYLGKNCLLCHNVTPGTILGAVSVEISLDRARSAATDFNQRSARVALLLLLPFCLMIWYAITRSVTRPLNDLTQGLWTIAEGDIEAKHRLAVGRTDETGEAALAFHPGTRQTPAPSGSSPPAPRRGA